MSALHLPKPKDTGLPATVHMLHQLAHIELNAIDLAWDTVARFAHLRLPLVRSQHTTHCEFRSLLHVELSMFFA